MRYSSYELDGRRRVGRVDGDRLVPLRGLRELGRDTSADILREATELPAEAVEIDAVRLRPVVPRPDKIICVGLNYLSHVGETGRELPEYPVLFTKFASSLISAQDDIVLPAESREVDYEGELAVVIGKPGRRIERDRALDHVLGYTVANDVTMRDYQYRSHQWLQGKAWDRSTPLGPHLVTADSVDVRDVGIRTLLAGATVQESRTSLMIFDLARLIVTVSEFTTILPGDVILTGTPGGVGYRRQPQLFLRDGDEITVEVDGVGSLTNTVRSEEAGARNGAVTGRSGALND